MNLLWLIVIILLVFALVGAPVFSHSRAWGWGPSGGLGLLLLIIVVLLLLGKL